MIVVGGEALVDLVPERAVASPELAPLVPRLGGGPYNVAVALARLDSPVSLLSRISLDTFGDALLHRLESSAVDTALVQRGPEPTTLAVVTTGADGSARYTFYVEGTADRLVADPGPLPARTAALSLGTLSLVLEPGATTYETVLHRAAQWGILVALDPNIRAELIEDPAAYRQRFHGWLAHVGLLKLSVEDARWLGGTNDRDPIALARQWVRAGPAAVVLTDGAKGMSVLTRGGTRVDVPGIRCDVADTIGAGDTVQAALLNRLEQHAALDPAALERLTASQWREILEFAARAAAVTCGRPGAEPPYTGELAEA